MLSACGGGGAFTAAPLATPTAQPTPTATPSLSANPTTLAFYTTGASAAQTVLVAESGYAGMLTEGDTCSGVASISPMQSTSPYTATVTPISAGTCTINFTDGTKTAPVSVVVTTSGVTINAQGKP